LNDDRPDPSSLPPGFSRMAINADTVDALVQYYELKDHGELFQKAVLMLAVLADAEQKGWHTLFARVKRGADGAPSTPLEWDTTTYPGPTFLTFSIQKMMDAMTQSPPKTNL